MKVKVTIEIEDMTIDEWIEQQKYIEMLKVQMQAGVSQDIITRIERLERIVFGEK